MQLWGCRGAGWPGGDAAGAEDYCWDEAKQGEATRLASASACVSALASRLPFPPTARGFML